MFQVEWPLNVILNQQCFAVYNKVFSFLLQIKRAKYCLDQLRFSGEQELKQYTQEIFKQQTFQIHLACFPSINSDTYCYIHSFQDYSDKHDVNSS